MLVMLKFFTYLECSCHLFCHSNFESQFIYNCWYICNSLFTHIHVALKIILYM